MNKKLKHKLVSLLLFVGLLSTNIYANETLKDTTLQNIQTTNGEVVINGEVQATVVSITVPQAISFILNPNGTTPEERFISPTFSIENNSNAPLGITIQSLRNKEDSPHKFTSVPFDKYTDEEWGKLNKKQSMSEIALGIDTIDRTQWRDETFNTYSSVENDVYVGALNPHSQADMKLIAKHGNAFESVKSNYQATFIFDLYNSKSMGTSGNYYVFDLVASSNGMANIDELVLQNNENNNITYEFIGMDKPNSNVFIHNPATHYSNLNDGRIYAYDGDYVSFIGTSPYRDRYLIKASEPVTDFVFYHSNRERAAKEITMYELLNISETSIDKSTLEVKGLYNEDNLSFIGNKKDAHRDTVTSLKK